MTVGSEVYRGVSGGDGGLDSPMTDSRAVPTSGGSPAAGVT